MINSSQFFEWMVQHHIDTNLPKCLPDLEVRAIQTGNNQTNYRENKAYDGTLLVADGEGLIERMVADGNAWGVGEERTDIRSAEDLSNYLNNLPNTDGGHIYDSVRRLATRVAKFRDPKNLPEGFDPYTHPEILSRLLPQDFNAEDGSIQLNQLGTRGLVFVEVPLVYPEAHVFEIKQSPFGALGIGKVVHVDRYGLVEEFFFRPNEDSLQNTLDPLNAVQGVYRRYAGQDKTVRTEEVRNLHLVYDPALALKK